MYSIFSSSTNFEEQEQIRLIQTGFWESNIAVKVKKYEVIINVSPRNRSWYLSGLIYPKYNALKWIRIDVIKIG